MMRELWNGFQMVVTVMGGWLGFFLGGKDGLMYALVVMVILDYVTGVMCAISDRNLSSSVGYRGICRKVLIFALVGVGHLMDLYVLGSAGVLRTAIVFFYLSNEGLSILENAAHLGLPIPRRLRKALRQLHERIEDEEEGETK
ncbi:toxin secretion/phage lysis holin [[Clostridium] aminophilum]|uniref:Toxin secretion/phage lysis holin n=2 Tax=[Clostridium] aminophilum TaxID=1526 RepID=A0A1I6KMH8_9FIRM|nr:toxin secretion/phage lysis holin [[Clostridium] aminophilum]